MFLGYSKWWQIKRNIPGLNGDLSINFWWLKGINHVKFTEESVICAEKHVSFKKMFTNGLNMDLTLWNVGKIVTYLTSMWAYFVGFGCLTKKKKKLKWKLTVAFIFDYLAWVTQTFAVPMQMRLCQVYKRSRWGNRGGGEFKEGVLHQQTRATGLSESTQKTVTLLKSTFKSRIYFGNILPFSNGGQDIWHPADSGV